MAIDTIKFKRGVKSKLNNLSYGEPAYISDENELYIGTENGVEKITSNKEVKELSSQLEHNVNLGYSQSSISNVKERWETIFVNVKDFGAKGDGVADDTQAIKDAISSLSYTLDYKTSRFYTLLIPFGWYRITDTIEFNKPFNVECLGNIIFDGGTNKPAIKITETSYREYKFGAIIDIGTYNDRRNVSDLLKSQRLYYSPCLWDNDNFKGIEMKDTKFCKLTADLIQGFTVGLDCVATKLGFWFNSICVDNIKFHKKGIRLTSDDANDSVNYAWLNANYFYNTAFSSKPRKQGEVIWDIKQDCINGNTYGGNSNYFYNMKFETSNESYLSDYVHLEIYSAVDWFFTNCRVELKSDSSIGFIIHESWNNKRTSQNINFINTPFNDNGRCKAGYRIVQDTGWGSSELPHTYSDIDYECVIFNHKSNYNEVFVCSDLVDDLIQIGNKIYHPKLSFASGNKVINGGLNTSINEDDSININFANSIVFELNNVSCGDAIKVDNYENVGQFVRYDFIDESGNFIEDATLSGGYRKYNESYNYGWTMPTNTLIVADKRVKSVRINIYNKCKGFKILTTSKTATLKKYYNEKETNLQLRNKYCVDSLPTTNNNLISGTVVYYNTDRYILNNVDNVLTWVKS